MPAGGLAPMSPEAAAAAGPSRRPGPCGAAALVILAATALRVVLAASIGLSVDESYSVAISRQLDWSYVDHPPLHVWIVGLSARALGSERALVLRLPFVLLFAGSSALVFALTRRLAGARAGFWAVLALSLTPLYTLAIGSWILPDGPLVCCALLTVWLTVRALDAPRSRAALTWAAVGASAGLTLLAKYLAVFPLAGLAVYLLGRDRRRVLATPGPWIALAIALVAFVPVLTWNAAHGWISFAFQGARARPEGLSLARLALDWSGQLAYLLPWTAAGLTWALLSALRQGPRSPEWLFPCLAVAPVACFAVAPLWMNVLPHWPAIGWLFAYPLLGAKLARWELRHPRALTRGALAAAAACVLILAVAAGQSATGFLGRLSPGFDARDPTVEMLDWHELRQAIATRRLLRPGMFIATVSWIDAGKIDYALGGRVPVLCIGPRPHEFAYLHDARELAGHDALIVADARRRDWLALSAPHFAATQPLAAASLTRGHAAVIRLAMAQGRSFKP